MHETRCTLHDTHVHDDIQLQLLSFSKHPSSPHLQPLPQSMCPPSARCLDQYFDLRRREVEGGEEGLDVDRRLVAVVERMLENAMQAGQWEQAVGVALEARRLDLLEGIVGRCPDQVRCQAKEGQ